MTSVRSGAAWIYRILIALFALGVLVEVFLAGLAIFRLMPDEDASVSHETIEDKFDAHVGFGWILFYAALLLLIVILIAWAGPRAIGATFALAVLTVVQGMLAGVGEDASVVGALHAVNAFLILGLSSFLALRAWRGGLLTPHTPLQAPAAASTMRGR